MILDPFLPSVSSAALFLELKKLHMFIKITFYIVILSLSNVITYFHIGMDNRGRHWKSIIIYDVTEAYLQKNSCFDEQKCISEHQRKGWFDKNILKLHY